MAPRVKDEQKSSVFMSKERLLEALRRCEDEMDRMRREMREASKQPGASRLRDVTVLGLLLVV